MTLLGSRSGEKIKVKRAFKNASILAVGNVAAQAISFLGFIYIARELGPSQFGIYQAVIAFVSLFVILTFDGINRAILREGSANLERIQEIFEASIGIRNTFSLLAMAVCIISAVLVSYDAKVKLLIIIYSVELVAHGVNTSLNTIYQAFEEMKYISYVAVIRTLVSVLLMVIFLHFGYGVMAMIFILTLTNIGALSLSYLWTRKFVRFRFFSKIRIQKETLKQGITFSAIQFVNTLSGRIDLVMLSFLTTPAEVGIYALGNRLVQKSGIFRNSLVNAFFPSFTKHFKERTAQSRTFFIQTLYLFGVLALGAVAAYFICPIVVPAVFGEKFSESVEVIQVLVFSLVFSYGMLPFATALQTTYNEKTTLWLGIVRAILNVSLNFLLFYKMGTVGIAYSSLFTYGIGTPLYIYFGYTMLKRQGYFA